MYARIYHKVLSGHGAIRRDIADMLYHRDKCDRCDRKNRICPEYRCAEQLIADALIHEGEEVCLPNGCKITEAHRIADNKTNDNRKQNRHQIEDTFCKN